MAESSGVVVRSVVCKRCKSKVVNGIKCQRCKNLFHISCAKLCSNFSVDKSILVCCESDRENVVNVEADDQFYDVLEEMKTPDKFLDPRIVAYILKQKDIIICELQDKIRILNNQIDLMSQLSTKSESVQERKNSTKSNSDKPDNTQPTYATKTGINDIKPSTKRQGDREDKKRNKQITSVTGKQFSADMMKVQTELKCNEIINLVKDGNDATSSQARSDLDTGPENRWTDVVKRGRRRQVIVGSNKELANVGVPSYTGLHIYRIKPDITVDHLTNLMRPYFPEIKCESLNSKHPNLYASFKVTLLATHFNKAMDASIWPQGACISRFLFKRKVSVPLT